MYSICGFEPTVAWGCVVVSVFCLFDLGITGADLLVCGDVITFTFLLRPVLP